jgi:hypothetical protein
MPAIVCLFAGMARSYHSNQINTAGGRPATSYFLLLRQNKVTKEKSPPVYRPCGVPCVARLIRRLWNSHDPLRGHVLKQSSPKSPGQPVLLGGAQGKGEVHKERSTSCFKPV